VITPTELTGSAVATYEANEALFTVSIKFVASVKIKLDGKEEVFHHNRLTILFTF